MTISNLRARTATAADIAGVNRQRFNEAVAEGFYPCAPHTIRGQSRVFDVNDIVTLCIYGLLIKSGVAPRSAGEIACGLRRLLDQHPEIDRAFYVENEMGSTVWLRPEDFHPNRDKPEPRFVGGAAIAQKWDFYLDFIRKRVIHKLEELGRIVGPDDGED